MCIDIVEIWFGIAIGYIPSIFTELSCHDTTMAMIISRFYLKILVFYSSMKTFIMGTHWIPFNEVIVVSTK